MNMTRGELRDMDEGNFTAKTQARQARKNVKIPGIPLSGRVWRPAFPSGRAQGPRFFAFGIRILCLTQSMQTRFAALWMLLVVAFAPAVMAGGKAEVKASVSFHIETEANDNPKMIFSQMTNGQLRYFRRMPEIYTKDVVAFNTCPADGGGEDYGLVFQLTDNAARRLAAITNANQGRWLLAQINGRVVDGVLIDTQINDGFLVIWKGATLADINVFDKTLPRIGQKGKKKKK